MLTQNDTSDHPNYDSFLFLQRDSEEVVNEIIESIIMNGAKILHTNYLKTQINPYIAKTIGQELIMNSMWAKLPLGDELNELEGLPDEDLELPKIDSWANGSLMVFESMPLRSSCPQEKLVHKISQKEKKPKDQKGNQNSNNEASEKVVNQKTSSPKKTVKSPKLTSNKTIKATKQSSGQLMMNRIFEETKKSNGKNITMDSDFNIIEITEHKSFTSSLIVPKVTTKRLQKDEPVSKITKPKIRIPIQKRDTKIRKKPLPKLLQVDTPIFDEDQQTAPVVENFNCSPGVTFKEGNLIKSKPASFISNEFTRAQYQEYLKELQSTSKGDFIE
ncbi:hypothetical protein M9Y10_004311 [Tritrichomonas musculus]|uniref:Uncharacterized protein n=1 Tax=Tritrichomonas musculus TaxID=1915356 RepID=A0ABR2JTM3_9EUKA